MSLVYCNTIRHRSQVYFSLKITSLLNAKFSTITRILEITFIIISFHPNRSTDIYIIARSIAPVASRQAAKAIASRITVFPSHILLSNTQILFVIYAADTAAAHADTLAETVPMPSTLAHRVYTTILTIVVQPPKKMYRTKLPYFLFI